MTRRVPQRRPLTRPLGMTAVIFEKINARNYVLQLDSRQSQHGLGFYMGSRELAVRERVLVTWREESHNYLIAGVESAAIGTVREPLVSGDDGWWQLSSGGAVDDTSNLLLARNISGIHKDSFIRFPDIAIAQGAVISNATLVLVQAQTSFQGETVRVDANDVDDAVVPTDADDADAKVRTTATATFLSAANGTVHSVDVTTIVNEILARGSWASGNAMMMFLKMVSSLNETAFWSFDKELDFPRLLLSPEPDVPTEALSIDDLTGFDLAAHVDVRFV